MTEAVPVGQYALCTLDKDFIRRFELPEMRTVILYSCSGIVEYEADSIPDFEEINTAMRQLKGYLPTWLIVASVSEKEN